MSPGHPTDMAYSLARPAILAAVWVEGECFYSVSFLLCPSLSSPLLSRLSPLLSILFLFSLSLGDITN